LTEYVTGLVVPGGVDKRSLALAIGVSVVSNTDILQLGACKQANVLIFNRKDSTDE
jgi:hypothetical protein